MRGEEEEKVLLGSEKTEVITPTGEPTKKEGEGSHLGSRVVLGFLEPIEGEAEEGPGLEAWEYPNLVGGRPRWLPKVEFGSIALSCPRCGGETTFLLQVYAPLESPASAYHRTLYLFVCTNDACHREFVAGGVKGGFERVPFVVWRGQRARGPEDDDDAVVPDHVVQLLCDQDVAQRYGHAHICVYCGQPATQLCAKCKRARYCSRAHQMADWSAGHKRECSASTPQWRRTGPFKSYELVSEEELEKDEKATVADVEAQGHEELRKMRDEGCDVELPTEGAPVAPDDPQDTGMDMDADESFLRFRKKVASAPDQVLRYYRSDDEQPSSDHEWPPKKAVWFADAGRPPMNLPNCACGASRRLELQVLPQLLNVLDAMPDLDWGMLSMFTCSASCGLDGYTVELLWWQGSSMLKEQKL